MVLSRFCACLAAGFAAAIPAIPTRAQNAGETSPVSPATMPRESCAAALRWIARKHSVAILAEGTPYRAKGSKPPLEAQEIAENDTPDALVAKVADAYDYRSERTGNLLVLHKNYTYPDDLPEVTGEELRDYYRRTLAFFDSLAPGYSAEGEGRVRPFFRAVWETIPEDIRKRMRRPLALDPPPTSAEERTAEFREKMEQMRRFRGVPVSELPPVVRDAVSRFVIGAYVDVAAFPLRRGKIVYDALARPDSAFAWDRIGDLRTFGFFYPIQSGRHFSALAPVRKVATDFASHIVGASEVMLVKDPIDDMPKADDYGPGGEPLPFQTETDAAPVTLADVAAAVNRRLDGKKAVRVEPGLAGKRILLVNGEAAEPETLLTAARDLYGLRFAEAVDGDGHPIRLLTFPSSPRLTRTTDLPRVIGELLPLPVQTALLRQPDSDAPAPLVAGDPQNRVNPDKLFRLRVRFTRMKHEAIRRTRVLVEPHLKDDVKEWSYSKFIPELKTLFTLVFTGDSLPYMAALAASPVPSAITRFDEAEIEGGVFTRSYQTGGGYTLFSFMVHGPDKKSIGDLQIIEKNKASSAP